MTTERWLPCPGYVGLYEVSDLGRVRALGDRWGRVKVLATCPDKDGYPVVPLTIGGRRGQRAVHRLVALAFHGDKRNILHREVAHRDGNRANTRADNLKCVSKRENEFHRRLHGTALIGELHGKAVLTEVEVRSLLADTRTARAIAADLGISRHTVADIRQGKRWKHLRSIHDGPTAKPGRPAPGKIEGVQK